MKVQVGLWKIQNILKDSKWLNNNCRYSNNTVIRGKGVYSYLILMKILKSIELKASAICKIKEVLRISIRERLEYNNL